MLNFAILAAGHISERMARTLDGMRGEVCPYAVAARDGARAQVMAERFGFVKSYAAVCLEGAIIVLACIIFSLFAASPPAVDPNAAAVTQVWSYIGELVFNMLVLVGAVKMADRVVREMMGL